MERKTIYHKSSSAPSLHNPSFSSSLLDSVYRSIDEEGGVNSPEGMVSYKGLTLGGSQNRTCCSFRKRDDEVEEIKVDSFQRVEKWVMDKRRSEEKAAFASRKSSSAVLSSSNSNSSSSSSDSSFWSGNLSSLESDSFYAPKSTCSSASSCYSMHGPKPIQEEGKSNDSSSQKSKMHHDHEEALGKAKSKALKIYAGLKKAKAKQPISPGGRLSSFLNSLFVNAKKKPKIVLETSGRTQDEGAKVKYSKSNSVPAYCPSLASSNSRSCLSKTPSSSCGKTSTGNGAKRSVRFDPVSVIVDGDSRPCGHKNLQVEDEPDIRVMEENRRVAEAARKLLESYRRMKVAYDPKSCDDDLSGGEDDDRESCSSSDLFELDNLSAVGIERYREELPVYETTHVVTNRAIASGLIL